MGTDLRRFQSGKWWWVAGGRPPIPLIRSLLPKGCWAAKVPADAAEVGILLPVVGTLTLYSSGAVVLRADIGGRFRCENVAELLEALDNLSGLGLRWEECLFLTDEPRAYRLAPWAWKTKPTFTPCYWNPGPEEGRGEGEKDG